MTLLTCPDCNHQQDVELAVDVYYVICEECGGKFDVPREHRVNKRTVRDWKSAVDIYIQTVVNADHQMAIRWRAEAAEGQTVFEQGNTLVDVSAYLPDAYGLVALVRTLKDLQLYRDGRIWVDTPATLALLDETGMQRASDEVITQIREQAVSLLDDRFEQCEVGFVRRTAPDATV